jgi:hypothetical protein
MAFLLQYTSTKFGWTLAAVSEAAIPGRRQTNFFKATILTTMRPAITIILYTLLLPTFNRFLLMRLRLSAGNADLVAAKVSPILSVLGLLLIGSSSTPWMLAIGELALCPKLFYPVLPVLALIVTLGLVVFTLGYGYTQSAQLFLASRVEKDQLGLLYTVTATISAIGGIFGAPVDCSDVESGPEAVGDMAGPAILCRRRHLCSLQHWDVEFVFYFELWFSANCGKPGGSGNIGF